MSPKSLVLSSLVVAALSLALGGCATWTDEAGGSIVGAAESENTKEVSSPMLAAEAAGGHDGMCSAAEIFFGCRQQACTHGTGLPSSQCPMGYYCWCW